MARIVDHGDFAEVVNDEGARLFCSTTVAGAQQLWARDGAELGRPDLVSSDPLQVVQPYQCPDCETTGVCEEHPFREIPHISDRVRGALAQLGFSTEDGVIHARTVEGVAEAGTVSDGRRVVRLRLDAGGRYLEAVDGWGTVERDCDLRDFRDPFAAIIRLVPALAPEPRRAIVNGEPLTLTPETILATRAWYADNARKCITEARRYVETGGLEGNRVNDLESYIAWREQAAADSLAGKGDHSFAFQQRAVAHQTGECVPMLSR